MSTAPEIPYTERDIKEDPTLVQYAVGYLSTYGGSFEPLVRAKNALEYERGLPAAVVRTVLNCMRNDSNVNTLLPTPRPPTLTLVQGDKKVLECDIVTSHHSHLITSGKRILDCPGIPYEVNRGAFELPAKVKAPWARAKTGKLLHEVALDGLHYITWYPHAHRLGYWEPPALYVKTRCKYPSYIRKPVLHTRILTLQEMSLLEMTICPHCTKVEE